MKSWASGCLRESPGKAMTPDRRLRPKEPGWSVALIAALEAASLRTLITCSKHVIQTIFVLKQHDIISVGRTL